MPKPKIETTVMKASATLDKVTKNKLRYVIDDNDEGIAGTIYLDKEDYKEGKEPKVVTVGVKVETEVKPERTSYR